MRLNHRLASVLLVVGFYNTVLAEDFQPKLEEIGQIDAARPVPAFSVIKVLDEVASRARSAPEMPLKQYQIHMNVDGFGSLHLGSIYVEGPNADGKTWRAGVDEQSVRAGWLKDAPDLLLVVWLEVPDPRGTDVSGFSHSSAIVRLWGDTLSVLHRAQGRITRRPQYCFYDTGTRTSHFNYDAKTHILTKKTSRHTALWSPFRHGLYRADCQDEGYRAVIHETLVWKWEYADGKLVHHSVELFYETQEGVTLTDIARFYLGPWARQCVILEANPDLAARHKDRHPGTYIYPPPGTMIRIPVPEDWMRNVDPL